MDKQWYKKRSNSLKFTIISKNTNNHSLRVNFTDPNLLYNFEIDVLIPYDESLTEEKIIEIISKQAPYHLTEPVRLAKENKHVSILDDMVNREFDASIPIETQTDEIEQLNKLLTDDDTLEKLNKLLEDASNLP